MQRWPLPVSQDSVLFVKGVWQVIYLFLIYEYETMVRKNHPVLNIFWLFRFI